MWLRKHVRLDSGTTQRCRFISVASSWPLGTMEVEESRKKKGKNGNEEMEIRVRLGAKVG